MFHMACNQIVSRTETWDGFRDGPDQQSHYINERTEAYRS